MRIPMKYTLECTRDFTLTAPAEVVHGVALPEVKIERKAGERIDVRTKAEVKRLTATGNWRPEQNEN